MSGFRIGALDVGRIPARKNPVDAIRETIALAPRLESFGYSRLWIGEHHGTFIAHSSPELLLPVIAGATKRIRIGTGGILLQYYSSLKVAKNFRLLEAIYPGRIDLGIARAKPSQTIADRLTEGHDVITPFENKVSDLLSDLRGIANTIANPCGVGQPEVWLLGTSTASMRLAAEYGTAFCLGLFLTKADVSVTRQVIEDYQRLFQPSAELQFPKWSIAVAGVCAETNERAVELPLITEEFPLYHAATVWGHPTVVGTPRECRDSFEMLRNIYNTNEFMFLDVSQSFDDRLRSFELIADALNI